MDVVAPAPIATNPSPGPNGAATSPYAVVDPARVVDHLALLLQAALGATREELEAPGSLLSPAQHADTLFRCGRFAADAQVLNVQKSLAPASELENGDAEQPRPPTHIYTICSDLTSTPTTVAFLVLLKRAQPLDPGIPLASQIQMLNLPGPAYLSSAAGDQAPTASPYEVLQLYLHNGLAPYFDASTKSSHHHHQQMANGGGGGGSATRGRADVDAKTGIPVTKKRFTELELSLSHLQQNVEIPEVALPFHPVVQHALEEAASRGARPTIDLIPAALLQDSTFLNNLQATVNSWIKSIQVITKMTRDPTTGTANQEINFWLSMESALESIEAQLRSEGVALTLEILKHAKRFQATVSFTADTGLKEAMDKVQKYNQLMRDFPLDELLSATAMPKVQDAVAQIFAHLNKKMRICPYPVRRALPLVEALSADLDEVLHRLLPGTELVELDYREFRRVVRQADAVFKTWDDHVKEFTNVAREVMRRRNEKFIPIKIRSKHADLQARLAYVSTFRDNHEQLQRTIVHVLGPRAAAGGPTGANAGDGGAGAVVVVEEMGDVDAVEEVRQAWEALRHVDLLDVSPEGTARWVKAENVYNERTSRVENSIIARLRDRLATARSANEMFRVFSKFNALFVRPKIRGAIAEYQTQLIDHVKTAIGALHERFKRQYGRSEAHAMAQLRDLPPVSGAIIWARQIERQLDAYMKKVEDVLGADWALHAEGQRLRSESSLFRRKLDTRPIFEAWLHDVQRRHVSISGLLFGIHRVRAAGNSLELAVNFDPQVIALFKETRNLVWLNFSVPHSVNNVAKEAKRVYPFAVSLMESVRTWAQTSRQIAAMTEVAVLLSGHRNEVHALIAKGLPLKWESFVNTYELHFKPGASAATAAATTAAAAAVQDLANGTLEYLQSSGGGGGGGSKVGGGGGGESKHVLFVREFAAAVSLLQAKTATLASIHAAIEKALAELGTCPYEASAFEPRLQTIQKAVDQLNLEQYVNLGYYVDGLNRQLKRILLARLQHAIQAWIKAFEEDPSSSSSSSAGDASDRRLRATVRGSGGRGGSGGSGGSGGGGAATTDAADPNVPKIERLVHEITMRNQVIYLDPPLEFARASWYLQLQRWLGVVCHLKKIKAARYQMTLGTTTLGAVGGEDPEPRFDDLPGACAEALARVQRSVERRIAEVGAYVDKWLQFQSLWDLQSEQVYELLGDQLPRWLQILGEIRRTRQTFDTTEVSRTFGHLTVDYDQVQTKVNAKYDQWQHEILVQFAGRLEARMREVHAEIERARKELEGQGGLAAAGSHETAEAVRFITAVQGCKRRVRLWAPEVEVFRQGKSTLVRQRYQFPHDWLHVEQIEGSWTALNDLLARRAKVVEDQMDALRAKIAAEDRLVADRIAEAARQWDEEKPVSGTIAPDVASATLAAFEARITALQEEAQLVARAKEALDLPTTTTTVTITTTTAAATTTPTAAAAAGAADSSAAATLGVILEEVQDFQSVWASLSTIWKSLNELREMLWTSVQPRKVRASLDGLIKMTKEMPSRMRQYAAFEHVQGVLRQYLKVNPMLADLKSEAVRDRHWTKIFKELRPGGKRYSRVAMTLGDVWDLNLAASEAVIKEVIAQAQGEMALEEFLKQVRETWTGYQLELVAYNSNGGSNSCRLIRGWDELFAKCSENLNSLQAMRHSPYYREFEEEASAWEDKLNRVHVLFDVWIDVQRQWVYLEGVFAGNADIKHLLPVESSRFNNINSEFFAVMRKVYKQPTVLDVLNIPNVQKSLERLAELLHKIQKALGEYLEKERVAFPRFYFVGDEDLLEMIGNSNDTLRIAKHFSKMFAGIAGLVMDEPSIVSGFTSREGEAVRLRRAINLVKTPRINDWLALLESGMRSTLAEMLAEAVAQYTPVFLAGASAGEAADGAGVEAGTAGETIDRAALHAFMAAYPSQIVVLAAQVVWTSAVDGCLARGGGAERLGVLFDREVQVLRLLADTVLGELDVLTRKKCEQLITECVHQRDVIERLMRHDARSPAHHLWLLQMRYVYAADEPDPLRRLHVHMANARLSYGFEYLGVPDRLVRTPLTDRCFLTLTQALCQRLGGSPYGPAGTGKTESVKALGVQLGRFTLVFCCDDTFDFQAMGRIFLGICQVGAWGCFDEFNRLEERILSAVSQQIQNIQLGLKRGAENAEEGGGGPGEDERRGGGGGGGAQIELVGRQLRVHANTGIFITMNPGYAGRSNLPDNLKKLFRSVAMSKPDKELIAEVMLYSQGFNQAKQLSQQTVPFFDQCAARLSRQAHYDFGLRALKSVLVSSGGLKRARLLRKGGGGGGGGGGGEGKGGEGKGGEGKGGEEEIVEAEIIVQSIRETIAPKLIKADVEIMADIEGACFPGVRYVPADLTRLEGEIRRLAAERRLVASDTWMTKILQLYQIQTIHHGVMMVGDAGSGKSAAWRLLLEALQRVEGVEGVSHVIDSKVMSKEALYGHLDATTREWTDGLFTGILRKIVDNLRGEDAKRHWIVFDGDVDPEWVENLNSVLDDNKLLTLPNGERLSLPANVRILFEVENLRYATLATVSRCGMVWFSDDTVTPSMMLAHYLETLRTVPFEDLDEDAVPSVAATTTITTTTTAAAAAAAAATTTTTMATAAGGAARALAVQAHAADLLRTYLAADDLLLTALRHAADGGGYRHIMECTAARLLTTLFSLLNKAVRDLIEYNAQHPDFPLEPEQVEAYLSKKLLLALVWALTGDCPLADRKAFGDYLAGLAAFGNPPADAASSSSSSSSSPSSSSSLIDFDVSLPRAEWTPWQNQVPAVEVNTHSITQTDAVIPTLDTVRHEEILYSWLAEHKPLLLCGPPGSGKTMTLFSALRKLPNMEVVCLNFSSATTPDLLVKTFEQYCEYRKTLGGVVLSPSQIGRWLVVFCDEINLPAPDRYGTQRAIAFLRQLVEHNGFWRASDRAWVTLDRIQFVGACNPPTDAGRTPLGARFLRHAPLLMVDYPGEQSLLQIYGTFNAAVLKVVPALRGYAEPLTQAMVHFYLESQRRFTPRIQPHYVYSPRELTRWVRGVYEAIRPLETLSVEGLVRVWAHEALRLFQDRLVAEDERRWTDEAVRRIALRFFPAVDEEAALGGGPILFSNWLSQHYVPVDRERLRDFVRARLRTFCEEEVDVPLILFNDVLEHVLRIDRVFRQPQGHLILIGVSGSGKTTLSRFVAWMNGLKVFQIKVHGRYSADDFDEDLREVLRRCGCKGEKVCFIMDEANVLDSGFLERMNTLLANAEVPGLFEGDDLAALMTACKEGAQRQGLLLDSQEELYKWFTQQIVQNLHVVFTMNPPPTLSSSSSSDEGGGSNSLSSKAATSPALFNRCVLNWFGDWSDQALFQVAHELTQSVDLDRPDYRAPDGIPVAYRGLPLPPSHREAVVNAMVHIHYSLRRFNDKLLRQQGRTTYLTPRHFLDFVAQYVKLYGEKREDLEEQQRHLNVGLEKLRDTVDKVRDLRASLAEKKAQLERKDAEANEKLRRMVADQREAEQRKSTSLEIQAALERQEAEVASRRRVVLDDLARAEPAVEEAKASVSSIKRQHLTEVRSMSAPPQGVRLALDAVCTLLGHRVADWKSIQAVVRRDDFIASIVNFSNERQMTKPLRLKMRNEFLANPEFTFDKVNRASKACGPLVQWVEAQVNYAEILDRVGPLRDEVARLEERALQTRAEATAVQDTIAKLEASIDTYKREYAALISETQAIKAEMARVQFKVDRSVRLLDSLASERARWEEASRSFETQIATLVGDVLVAAAFLAYGGLYDQTFRKAMTEDWLHQLHLSGIRCKPHNPVVEYLSTADERLAWQEHALPVDDLCTENAIILKRFNRYPLIIDPSGRVAEFLQKECSGGGGGGAGDRRALTVTSFLDDSFTKQLESALRFGNPILIQDAEHLDPILNHVLNKEYQKTGGRVLIQLGKQEIDFSPSFRLYLSTRDPSATFAPDVCSRTTFVNFTVTQSSLQTQSLNDVLKSERPDVDERRSNLIKLQGEFKVHLRQLEKRLLQALNESRGNILDDDRVIETLETLKTEAADISAKMTSTEGVMAEVEAITLQYDVVARSCSAVFAVLEQLHYLNHFYQFSLQYFLDIFHSVLRGGSGSGSSQLARATDHDARRDIIVRDLFVTTFQRTALGLLQKDRITLAMLLVQASPYKMDKGLLDVILDDRVVGADVSTDPAAKDDVFARAKRIPALKKRLPDLPVSSAGAAAADWDRFFAEELAENFVPQIWDDDGNDGNESRDKSSRTQGEIDRALLSLLLVKLFRLDRFVPAAERFVSLVFGPGLFDVVEDLQDTVMSQGSATRPIALVSSPGFDASYKVDNLVERLRVRCTNIAMGSNEGLASADKAIGHAAQTGTWVLVKNVHLAPTWLQSLEKRMESLHPHADFRLFLSMESSNKIPVNLLRASRVLMYEQPAGIRANMKDSMSSLLARPVRRPVERARLYLLLSFLHAVVQERLRYAPNLGWKGFWEFNDADYECSAFVIDTWIDYAAQNRSNIAPQNIPWEMIRTLVTETYGGKIDDEGDFRMLAQLVLNVLTPAAFDIGHKLVEGGGQGEDLLVPSGTSMQEFMSWIHQLPEREPPTYLGLPANAEKLLLVGLGRSMIGDLKKITDLLDEGEQLVTEA